MSCFYCLVWVNVLDRLSVWVAENSLTRRLKCVCWCHVSSLHVQSWQLHSVQLLLHHVHHPQKVWKLCLRVLSTEEKNTISVGKGYCLTSEAGGHGNQPLIKCNFVCLCWTFINVITLSSELVFEGYLLLFQVKIVKKKIMKFSSFGTLC